MKKLILAILFIASTTLSIGQTNNSGINFGSDTSIEIDMDDSYRIYMKFDNPQVLKTVKLKLQKALLKEGIIDSTEDSDAFKTTKKTDGDKEYSFEIDGNSIDCYINKDLLTASAYINLKKECKEIYNYIKSNTKKEDTVEKPKAEKKETCKTESRNYSFSVTVDIENSDDLYSVVAKYDEEGQYEKLIIHLKNELGTKNMIKENEKYSWINKSNDELIYRFQISKGKFKVLIDKAVVSKNYFDTLKQIAEVGNLIVKSDFSVPPNPPER